MPEIADVHHIQFLLSGLLLAALLVFGVRTAAAWRPWTRLPKGDLAWLLACLALAAALRLAARTFPSDAVLVSSQGSYIGISTHRWGPAFSVLLHLLYLVFPSDVRTVAGLNVVLGTLTVAAVFAFTAAYFQDRLAAFSAAAALACHPVLVRYSASDSNFVMLTLCLFLSLLFLSLWKREGRDSLLWQGIGWLAVAANVRGEAVAYAVFPVLVLAGGGERLGRAELRRAAAAGLAGAAVLIYPAAVLLAELSSAQGHRGLFSPLGLAQAFFLGRNSPVLLAGFALLGLAWALAARTRRALGFLAVLAVASLPTGFQAWEDLEIMHRHVLPHLALWCVFAGCGLAAAAARLPRWRSAAVLALVLTACAPHRGFLTKTWTHALEYEFITGHLGDVPEDCLLVTPAVENSGLFITQNLSRQVGRRHRWIAAARLRNLSADRCAVFYRGAACWDRKGRGSEGGEHPFCAGLSERFGLEPLWTADLPALPYAEERYAVDPVPVGFYRLKPRRPLPGSGAEEVAAPSVGWLLGDLRP